MPHFLRVKKTALHVPSISSVIMETSCLGQSYLRIYYHNTTKPTTLSYSNLEEWWADYRRIKEAINEVSQLLSSLPLTSKNEEIVVEVPKHDT